MTWLKYSTVTCFLFFIFFISFNTHAQQMSRLPCEKSWWLSDPTLEDLINTIQDISDMFQICNENQDRPIHIGLKLEDPLSQDQTVLLVFLVSISDPISIRRLYRNKQGETPLMLAEMRLGRTVTNAFDKSISYMRENNPSEQEMKAYRQRVFQEDILREITLYITTRVSLGDSLEDAWNDVMLEVQGTAMRNIESAFQDLLEYLEQINPSDLVIPPNNIR